MVNSRFDKDLKSFLEIYPKFEDNIKTTEEWVMLNGEIDICDIKGTYLISYAIEIYIEKKNYPYCVPIVKEIDEKIQRHDDWHINKEGFCCLDMNHELEYISRSGINIISFYQQKIYPYFANALYKKHNKEYADGEYRHGFDGIVQFYREKLKLTDFSVIIRILNSILKNNIPGRNESCICGSGIKIKRCHLDNILFLKSLSKETLQTDLEGFKKNIVTY